MAKNSTSNLADAIGLPDMQDKLRIQLWVEEYEREHPGEFAFHRDAARARLKDPKFGVIDDQSARRYLFELPTPFGNWLSQAYPLMFKDKKHLQWFVKNFPQFLIPEKW